METLFAKIRHVYTQIIHQQFGWLIVLTACVYLIGCSSETTIYAPVTDGWAQPLSTQGVHIVRKGESLYSIAWRYGKDYREIAHINHIEPPYHLTKGQYIKLVPGKIKTSSTSFAYQQAQTPRTVAMKPVVATEKAKPEAKLKTSAVTTIVPRKAKPIADAKLASDKRSASGIATKPAPIVDTTSKTTTAWIWPAKGKIISSYASTNGMNKGIDIAGNLGEPIKATASGKVVYSGNGLRGYGELIIIKHNEEFLSAYAHNRKLLVREGAQVKAGQVIAEMGDSEAKRIMLHFEIRKAGKPVDPTRYLAPY